MGDPGTAARVGRWRQEADGQVRHADRSDDAAQAGAFAALLFSGGEHCAALKPFVALLRAQGGKPLGEVATECCVEPVEGFLRKRGHESFSEVATECCLESVDGRLAIFRVAPV